MPAAENPITTQYSHAIPCLSYADTRTAIQWLVDTFGAEARLVYDGPDERVAHAELWFGNACVMMGTLNDLPPSRAGESSVYLVLGSAAQVDAMHERAQQAGARMLRALHDSDYGSRDFTCRDPEGNAWSFGTYVPK